MLPEDTKQCKEAALDSASKTQQTSLGDHFSPADTEVIPYSDWAFEAATIEWLVSTNQVCIFIGFLFRSDCFCFSQSILSRVQGSRRCLISHPEQAAASHYRPQENLHANHPHCYVQTSIHYADTLDCIVYFSFSFPSTKPVYDMIWLCSCIRYDLAAFWCTISISEPHILQHLVLGELRFPST